MIIIKQWIKLKRKIKHRHFNTKKNIFKNKVKRNYKKK